MRLPAILSLFSLFWLAAPRPAPRFRRAAQLQGAGPSGGENLYKLLRFTLMICSLPTDTRERCDFRWTNPGAGTHARKPATDKQQV